MTIGRTFLPPSPTSGACGGLALMIVLGLVLDARAATPASPPHASAPAAQGAPAQHPASAQPAEQDQASRNVVARARMLECGHQWSNMKRAGTASGTWKDFSRACLAQR